MILATEAGTAPRRGLARRILRGLGLVLLALPLMVMTLWAVAALYLDARIPWLRLPLAAGYALALLLAARASKQRWQAAAVCLGGFTVVLAWWLSLRPANDRDWKPDVAVLPWAEFAGEQVTLHNIRNCDYRTETNFVVRHYDKTYDLSKLRTLDFYLVHWGSPWIGHTMLSFGFEGGDYLCISIETRMEKGESYSALRGFFRQFELTYVVADERDVVRLRTNYRKDEEVLLYRLRTGPERVRAIFEQYLRRANSLRSKPEWYNALTHNCTTNIRLDSDAASGRRSPFDLRILLNGRIDELLAAHGTFAADLPLIELRSRGHINDRARQADQSPDFSRCIRDGIPGMDR